MVVSNLLWDLPDALAEEVTETLVQGDQLRIERIVSHGQCSATGDWYDQDENEWVLVMQGRARLEMADGVIHELGVGDYIQIPAHQKHRVAWTDQAQDTIWLAIFY
jgi:cupin 2 domain-containing protein